MNLSGHSSDEKALQLDVQMLTVQRISLNLSTSLPDSCASKIQDECT
jgi:hypothetical protein